MNEFEIFADSGANLPDDLRVSRGVRVIPYIISVNGEDVCCLQDGVPYEQIAKEFYDKMRAGAEIKTSLIGQERIEEAFIPALEEGKDIIMVTISSGISGTYNQAVNASKALKEKYPDRKIYIIDGANASLGAGMIVLKLCDLRDMGQSIDACYEWGINNAYKVNSYFTVDDLKYLRKGGRISMTLAIAGTLLNIKPILCADGGIPAKLTSYGKTRGRKKSIQELVAIFDRQVVFPEGQTVCVTHCDCEEDALELAALLKEHGAGEVLVEYYDMCTGAHAGPGTLALFFFGKDRRADAPQTAGAAALKRAPEASKV